MRYQLFVFLVKCFFSSSWKFYTVFFQKSSSVSSSLFNPILYIDPINIERIHRDFSFKGFQIADIKLDEEKSHAQHARYACTSQAVTDAFSCVMIDNSYTLHSTLRTVIRQQYWCLNLGNRLHRMLNVRLQFFRNDSW